MGDFLGTNGIADEMIRFNGFPFLEKEDHAYNVEGQEKAFVHGPLSSYLIKHPSSVSAVMRTDIHVLVETGMQVKDVGQSLGFDFD